MKTNNLRTIDDFCNQPRGSFKKFIKDREDKARRYFQYAIDKRNAKRLGLDIPDLEEDVDLSEIS